MARIEQAAAASAARADLESLKTFTRLFGCKLIGGFGHEALGIAKDYDLYFGDDEVLLIAPRRHEVVARLQYRELLALRTDGPGAVTSGGGFIGGGFGLEGAAEGMIVASLLNSLTTRTKAQTILEVQDRDRDLIFFTDAVTPHDLRVRLMPVEAKLRASRAEPVLAHDADPLDRLEKLARLQAQGILNDKEFESAKGSILRNL